MSGWVGVGGWGCVCVGVWVGAWVGGCARVCVCVRAHACVLCIRTIVYVCVCVCGGGLISYCFIQTLRSCRSMGQKMYQSFCVELLGCAKQTVLMKKITLVTSTVLVMVAIFVAVVVLHANS